ncbi:MAG: hypothetical protein ACK59C_04320 [Holosporales bacterium]
MKISKEYLVAGASIASIAVLGSGITLATLILARKCTDYIIDNKLSPKSVEYWLAISLTAMAATGSAIGPLLIENKIHTFLKPPSPPTSLVNKTVIPESMPQELREVVDTTAKSVVKINIGKGEGACSGSVVGPNGSHIFTAAHCIPQYYSLNYPPKFGPVNKVQIMVGKTDDDEDPEGVREGI